MRACSKISAAQTQANTQNTPSLAQISVGNSNLPAFLSVCVSLSAHTRPGGVGEEENEDEAQEDRSFIWVLAVSEVAVSTPFPLEK